MLNSFRSRLTGSVRIIFLSVIFSIVCLSYSQSAFAQKTAVYLDPYAKYKDAVEHFSQKNYIIAKKMFEEITSYTPRTTDEQSTIIRANSEYYIAVSSLEMYQPDAEQRLLTYIKDYHETPNARKAYFHLGRYYYRERKFKDAAEWLSKVDIQDLDNDEVAEHKFILAYSSFLNKDFPQAKRLFRDIRNVQNKYYYPSNYYYGFIAFEEKDYDEALQSFEKVQESNIYKSVVPYYIATIYFMRGDYEKVLSYAPPLLDDPNIKNQLELNQLIGQAYFERKEYEKALPYLTEYNAKSRKLRKEDAYQLGFTEYKLGLYDKAIGNFRQLSVQKDSIGQNSMYLLADAYLKKGDKENAKNAFLQASRQDFDPFVKEQALFNYAKLSLETGFDKAGISSLQEYIKTYPRSQNIQEAKELLTIAFLSTNNYREALEILKTMDGKSPRMREAYQKVAYYQAVEQYNDKNYFKSLESFNESMKFPIEPTFHALSHYWKGEIYYIQGKYDESIASLGKFLELQRLAKGPEVELNVVNAHYTLGYNYFNKKSYGNALTNFNKALESSRMDKNNRNLQRVNADATLRTADSYFMLKDYDKAVIAYNTTIINNHPGAEYAQYQKGTLLGLQGKTDEKISTLQAFVAKYPRSNFAPDALLEISKSYITQDKSQSAITYLDKLIKEFPQNQLVRQAYLRLGLIYYNRDEPQRALDNYKIVVERYPGTAEAKEALLGIKDISISTGRPEVYISVLEKTPGANITVSTQDSVTYLAAEQQYLGGKYDEAISSFNNYLNKFPNGAFITQARYYRAESLNRKNDITSALNDYEFVIAQPANRFTENSLARASQINFFNMKNYDKAYEQFRRLHEVASFKDNRFNAVLGLMRTSFFLKKYGDLENWSKQVKESDQATSEEIIEAHYYLGKAAMAQKKYEAAMVEFTRTAELSKTRFGVEAKYNMALIHFERGDIEQAKAVAMAVKDHVPYYEEWVIRSFLLLSDIFVKEKNLFQAKATLMSILDNYKGENTELRQEAQQKLKQVEEMEKAQSKISEEASGVIPDIE